MIQWLLSTWLARKLRGRKTYVFAGALALIAVDHFAGTHYSRELLAGGDLTNGQAVISGLLGLAFAALKAGTSRQDREVKDMIGKLLDAVEKASKAAPAVLLAVGLGLALGCSTTKGGDGVQLGNALAGVQVGGSIGVSQGGAIQAGVTLVGQQGGIAVELNPAGAEGTIAVSGNLGLCDALRALGMPPPEVLCGGQ